MTRHDIYSQNMTKVFDNVTGQWLGDIQGDLYAGDSTKAFNELGWKHIIDFDTLVLYCLLKYKAKIRVKNIDTHLGFHITTL